MTPLPFARLRAWDDASAATRAFREIFDAAFPEEERRTDADWPAALADPLCNARLYRADGNARAILVFWDFGRCRYVEYFALAPEARGGGLGSRLLREFLAESAVPVVLEIEPPEDETTTRRLRFYERLGFARDAREHFHPPYRAGFGRQRLVVLNSGGKPLAADARERFERELETRAMRGVPAAKTR